ncbi:hypothetical protein XENORESO_004606 [Xenotaenia resolanae]|uniref:Uncharacterized protein n=1 Tax=Xenotaenia resolanae TaxID=208358 RepID=A0ABV0X6P2_9TELE
MGRPLAGSEQRGAFISDPQVRPRCLSCQNSPIQHCAEFINALLTLTHTEGNVYALQKRPAIKSNLYDLCCTACQSNKLDRIVDFFSFDNSQNELSKQGVIIFLSIKQSISREIFYQLLHTSIGLLMRKMTVAS